MNKQDGGPAFPAEQHETQNGEWNQTFEPGLSLRDYFAAAALQGYMAIADERAYSSRPSDKQELSPDEWRLWLIEQDAKLMYLMADAMLKAREQ